MTNMMEPEVVALIFAGFFLTVTLIFIFVVNCCKCCRSTQDTDSSQNSTNNVQVIFNVGLSSTSENPPAYAGVEHTVRILHNLSDEYLPPYHEVISHRDEYNVT